PVMATALWRYQDTADRGEHVLRLPAHSRRNRVGEAEAIGVANAHFVIVSAQVADEVVVGFQIRQSTDYSARKRAVMYGSGPVTGTLPLLGRLPETGRDCGRVQ